MKRLLVALVLVGACGGGPRPVVAPTPTGSDPGGAARSGGPGEEVTFTADDGVALAGSYYAPEGAAPACLVLVHQLSSTRAEWQPIIDQLRGSAHILAFDMRGHGASTQGADGAAVAWKTFETADWEKVEGDIGKAMEVLAGRGASGACALAGASIGSSAVLRYAGAHPDKVTALVLLSPGLAYRGVKTPDAARANRAPVVIVHSQEPGAADAAGALKGIWDAATPPVPVQVISDPGQEHGMKIVNGDPAILERVAAFLREPRP